MECNPPSAVDSYYARDISTIRPYMRGEIVVEDNHNQADGQQQGGGEGRLLLNIGKIIFLIAVLVAFWYFFDKWLGGR